MQTRGVAIAGCGGAAIAGCGGAAIAGCGGVAIAGCGGVPHSTLLISSAGAGQRCIDNKNQGSPICEQIRL